MLSLLVITQGARETLDSGAAHSEIVKSCSRSLVYTTDAHVTAKVIIIDEVLHFFIIVMVSHLLCNLI
jgi:hypothetical protein